MLSDGYRPVLDGLRGIAVLAVILYHLELPPVGGFLGVDLFFVLSGYLITRLLLEEHQRTGRISLGHFWARRVRRLLPAALLVVAACAVAARFGPVADVEARRGDLIATIFYYANWHFIATDQSYFAMYNGVSPLRHMWSLAIEEQFYVAWPLITLGLLHAGRGRARWFPPVVGLGAACSVVTMAAVHDVGNPSRAYFGTDARLHVLLVGALLAVLLHQSRPRLERAVPQRAWAALATGSALGVLLAFVLVTDTSPAYYRGGALLFAVVAATLLLALELGPQRGVGAVLQARPLVAVGRISYGLYLWHWPVIVLIAPSGTRDRLLVVVLTAAAAAASYVLVERPVRRGRVPWLRHSIPRLGAVTPLVLGVAVVTALQLTDRPEIAVVQQLSDTSVTACPPPQSYCVRVPAEPGRPMVAVAGDSTSLALDPGMRVMARELGFGYTQAGRNGCSFVAVPVGAPGPAGRSQAEACAASAEPWLERIQREVDPDVWVFSDRFLLADLHSGAGTLSPTDPSRRPVVVRALVRTLRRLVEAGDRVVLLETPPRGEAVDCALGKADATCDAPAHSTRDPATRLLTDVYRDAAAEVGPSVRVVPTADLLCTGPAGACRSVIDGVVVRYDGIHYTAGFSRRLVRQLIPRLDLLAR